MKKYYSIAGMMVATQDASGLQYLLTDHLGSTVAVTNSSGTLTSQQRYLPFGGTRAIPNSPILGTDFGYTGQRLLDEDMGGIMDYKARFYSPALGRFLQPDSIIPNPANPQVYNRYSYVINNPILFNDPTGHEYCGPDNIYCGGLAENDYYSVPRPGGNGGGDVEDDDDEITPDPDDESDSCTPSNCEIDCSDPAWDCVTHVEGTWADPAVYISGTLACLATGACLAAGVSALNVGYEALALRCLMSVVCRALTGAGGVGYGSVNTPHGTAYQSTTPQALQARIQVQNGANLYKLGTFGPSNGVESQFWSLRNPLLNPSFASQYGIPAENLASGNTFLLVGRIKDTAVFVTRSAPAVGSNAGGSLEVVVQEYGVQILEFIMP